MKKIYYPLVATVVALSTVATGCIEETFPTSGVTQDQVQSTPSAAASFANGIPAFFLESNDIFGTSSRRDYDWGYGSIMHIRDVMTGDMPIAASPSGYDWYDSWEKNEYQGTDYIYGQFIWNYYCQQILTTNLTIGAVDIESATNLNKYYYAAAKVFRAMLYTEMAAMYEYLPTDGTEAKSPEGNDILGLTVPIVTETMTEAEARENPRATHAEMLEFILNDLKDAEEYIEAIPESDHSKVMPGLAVLYGIYARAYMWDQDYPNAEKYARMAINAHKGAPTTEAEWLNKTSAFNKLDTSSWMWGIQYTSEDSQVKTGIINWISWVSNEYKAGYAAAEPFVMIDKSLYDKINNADFRKLTFVAPEGSPLAGKENFINRAQLESVMISGDAPVNLTPYSSLKIKPGEGNMLNYVPACVVAFPLMRVEEMYFIEAEAAAHQNASRGKQLIESFMKTYRYDAYACAASGEEDVVNEIFLQKRIEFFSEGIVFFDYKRLNVPVTRYYSNSNWQEDRQFNTTTRPAWMNIVIVQTEPNNNAGVRGYNNPDPTSVYKSLGAPQD